ncbi:cytochrome D1 domain-containing protein [Thiobacter aerophilum]|uniref:Cytochrome D1 domain-containing protein n=1 Tax=Thiobacter aerophilum TaxID=3121275 RepID=A0ABV0EHF4_9BURK
MHTKKKLIVTALVAAFALAGCATTASAPKRADVKWPNLIVHLHGGNGKAYLVDPATDSVVATLDTEKSAALGGTTPDGRKVYVGAEGEGKDTVTVIDLDKRAVVAKVKTGNRPKHPVVSPNGKLVMVNYWGLDDGKLRVAFIDTATDKVVKNVDLSVAGQAKGPTSMHNAWSYDSRYAFTVDRVDNHFVIIDTTDWSVKKIKMPSKPHYVAPSPDGKEVWVVVEGEDRDKNPPGGLVYSIGSFEEIAQIKMPLIGQGVIEGHHGNFSQDGKYFFILNRGPGGKLDGTEVAVFDAATKKFVTRTDTGSTGIGHTYNTPDGRYEVVTNYGNNLVSVIDNTQGFKVVKNLAVGKGRMGHIAFTPDGRYGYLSNAGDGNLHKLDMQTLTVVKEIKTGNAAGGSQVLNVWTNVFEELPR